jgi:hypothetical protein
MDRIRQRGGNRMRGWDERRRREKRSEGGVEVNSMNLKLLHANPIGRVARKVENASSRNYFLLIHTSLSLSASFVYSRRRFNL